MQLRPVARRLALKSLKPIVAHAAKGGTLPNRASYGLRPFLPRISHSSAPLPAAPCSVRRMGRCSFPPAPRTMARDEAEREPAQQAPANSQGDEEAAAERKPAPREERSMAYQIFAGLYVCAYVFCWRTGELITVNAQEALGRLRRYVRDNFFNNRK